MRFDLTQEVMVFFAVLIVATMAIFFTTSSGMGNVTFLAFTQPKAVFDNTVVLQNLNIGETFSQDVPPLTGTFLKALRDKTISTNEGTSSERQVIRLSDSDFSGGQIAYEQDPSGDVGDFLRFMQNQPLFEWEAIFSPALESRIESSRLTTIEDERVNILGTDYVIQRAELVGDHLTLRFFGPSFIEFEDDIGDQDYTKHVKVSGRTVNDASVQILATRSGNRIRISSIKYRFDGDHREGGDVLVPPRRGVRQYLRQPEGMLNPRFEIIYGGIRDGLTTEAIRPTSRVSGNTLLFKPSGRDQYRLFFTNVRGDAYSIPFATLKGGGVGLGDDDTSLVVTEGSNSADYNIRTNDMFAVTSDTGIKGNTNILEFEEADTGQGVAYFIDRAGGKREETFDTTTGEGTLYADGETYAFKVDLANPSHIVVDQDNDGSFSGSRADIVILGGARLRVTSSGPGSIGLDFRTPKRLFEDASSDEVVSFSIAKDSNEIQLNLADQSSLTLEQGRDRVDSGMTDFGTLFRYDENNPPSELSITFPTGGRYPSAFVRGGQANGWVIVTLELDRLLAAAQERMG